MNLGAGNSSHWISRSLLLGILGRNGCLLHGLEGPIRVVEGHSSSRVCSVVLESLDMVQLKSFVGKFEDKRIQVFEGHQGNLVTQTGTLIR